jgi:hypothetical protein
MGHFALKLTEIGIVDQFPVTAFIRISAEFFNWN